MSLVFFNDLGGSLDIETSEEPKRIGNLLNQYCEPTNKLLKVSWEPHVYTEDSYRDLTQQELDSVVLEEDTIMVDSHACMYPSKAIEHKAPNGECFTVKDMIQVVCKQETLTRGDTDWFGGMDVHHVFFEGMILRDGVWTISWGS